MTALDLQVYQNTQQIEIRFEKKPRTQGAIPLLGLYISRHANESVSVPQSGYVKCLNLLPEDALFNDFQNK